MIIEISGQPMFHDLLQNYNEGINQIFVVPRVNLNLIAEVVQRGSHNRGVFITECLLHFDIHLLDTLRIDLKELNNHNYCLLPYHFMIM